MTHQRDAHEGEGDQQLQDGGEDVHGGCFPHRAVRLGGDVDEKDDAHQR
jgi:hypothetical protein